MKKLLISEDNTIIPKYRDSNNYRNYLELKDFEKPVGVSLTIPNDAYTVEEILAKFTRGVPLELSKLGSYQEDPDFDGIPANEDISIDEINDLIDEVDRINNILATAKSQVVAETQKKATSDITEQSEGAK